MLRFAQVSSVQQQRECIAVLRVSMCHSHEADRSVICTRRADACTCMRMHNITSLQIMLLRLVRTAQGVASLHAMLQHIQPCGTRQRG